MTDDIEWLLGEFEARKQRNPRFSLRAFAQKLDISAGHLSDILARKRPLSLEMSAHIAGRLGVTAPQPPPDASLGQFLAKVPALPPPRQVIGRASQMEQLERFLQNPEILPRLALTGQPGVGKSTVAYAFCLQRTTRLRYPDGILWLQVGPTPRIEELHLDMANALGMLEPSGDHGSNGDWRARLEKRLLNLRLLVVLDDVWDPATAESLALGGPFCCHLLTTRLPALALDFAGPEAISVPPLREHESLALLQSQAPEAMAYPESQDFARAAAGLPAVLVAGAALLRRSLRQRRRMSQIFSELLGLLGTSQANGPSATALELTLSALFRASIERLSREEQRVLTALCQLGPAPSTFSEEAARAVAACELETLDALCDAGLLLSASDFRLQLPPVVRAIHRESDSAAAERMWEHFCKLLPSLRRDFNGMMAEMGNLERVLSLLQERRHWALAENVLSALGDHLMKSGRREHLHAILRGLGELPPHLEFRRRILMGRTALLWGPRTTADEHFARARALARECGQPPLEIEALCEQAEAARSVGRNQDWKIHLHEAVSLFRNHRQLPRPVASRLLLCHGRTLARQGGSRAERYVERARWHARSCGELSLEVHCLQELSILASLQGDFARERDLLAQAVAVLHSAGPDVSLGSLFLFLGAAEARVGNMVKSRSLTEASLAESRKQGNLVLETRALLYLAPIYAAEGEIELARQTLREGIANARAAELPFEEASGLQWMAKLEMERNGAIALSEEALAIAERLDQPYVLMVILQMYADCMQHIEENAKALAALARAREIAAEDRFRAYRSALERDTAEILVKTNELGRARCHASAALAAAEGTGNGKHQAFAHLTMARIEECANQRELALKHAEKALTLLADRWPAAERNVRELLARLESA